MMEAEHPDVRIVSDRFLILPFALVFLLVAIVVLTPDLTLSFLNTGAPHDSNHFNLRIFDLLFLTLEFVLFFTYVVLAIVTATRKRFRALTSYAVAILLLTLAAVYFKYIVEEMQVAKIFLFQEQFDTCVKSGAKYANSSVFKVCSTVTHGNSFLSIMYDSGHQIALPVSQRSTAFNEFIAREVGPLLTECEVYSRNASGSFFFVRSDCG